jgi:hypothetical protein
LVHTIRTGLPAGSRRLQGRQALDIDIVARLHKTAAN